MAPTSEVRSLADRGERLTHRAPEVWIGEDESTLAREGARRIAEAARRAISARGRFLIALSGGTTPRRIFRILAAEEHGVDWGRVEIVFGDERLVPHDDAASNYRMARETLLDHVPVDPARVHPMPTDLPPAEAARAYEQVLLKVLDPREPRLDLVLLGMGPDGHTASIFPGSNLLQGAGGALCVAVLDAPKAPAQRLTLTPPVINAARQVLVLVAGEDKVAAVSAALESDAEPSEIPIRAISPENGVLSWLLDRRAARALTNPPR